jgi:hypothetical protein
MAVSPNSMEAVLPAHDDGIVNEADQLFGFFTQGVEPARPLCGTKGIHAGLRGHIDCAVLSQGEPGGDPFLDFDEAPVIACGADGVQPLVAHGIDGAVRGDDRSAESIEGPP